MPLESILKRMLVTHKSDAPLSSYLDFIRTSVASGVTSVQLREKTLSRDALLHFGEALRDLLTSLHIPLIINDHVDIALALQADGIHLGQQDMYPCQAREILGDAVIIGWSVDTEAQLEIANTLPIDYIGIGAIFPTQHKSDITTIWGLDGLARAARISKHPIVAIGGIEMHNIPDVLAAGADGIAGIGLFHHT